MLNDIISKAEANFQINEGDYYEDGILYCGKCHTKKQHTIDLSFFGQGKRIVPCLCACESERRASAAEAQAKEQEKINRERKRADGFPDRAMMEWNFDADDGANPELTNLCKRYTEHFREMYQQGKGLLLYGGVGAGKTFMASCIANALIDKGHRALVTNFARIANELQADFNHRQAYLDNLNQYDLIVIDDLAAERDTEYMNEIVMNVIDSRYRVKKPLIVTTNLTGEELRTEGEIRRKRVISRLYEMCIPYEVKGTDRRADKLRADMVKYDWLFGKE